MDTILEMTLHGLGKVPPGPGLAEDMPTADIMADIMADITVDTTDMVIVAAATVEGVMAEEEVVVIAVEEEEAVEEDVVDVKEKIENDIQSLDFLSIVFKGTLLCPERSPPGYAKTAVR